MAEAKEKTITITNIGKIVNKRIPNTDWCITNAHVSKCRNPNEGVYIFYLKVIATSAALPPNKAGAVVLKRKMESRRSGDRVKFTLTIGHMERTYDTAIEALATIDDFVKELEDCIFNFTLFNP